MAAATPFRKNNLLEQRWRRIVNGDYLAMARPMRAYHDFVVGDRELSLAASRLGAFRDAATWLVAAIRPGGQEPPVFNDDFAEAAFGWAILASTRLQQDVRGTWGRLRRLADEKVVKHPPHEKPVREHHFIVQTYLRPLHEYLAGFLDEQAQVFSAIKWFQQWAAWFGFRRLADAIKMEQDRFDKKAIKRRQFEKRMQEIFFERLFEYGLSLIAREPATPGGEPDFVFEIGTVYQVVEVKVLDDRKGYTKSQLPAALKQTIIYMDNFNAEVGYLVLFDKTAVGHHTCLGHAADGLSFLEVAGNRRIYVVVVDAARRPSATQRSTPPVSLVTADFDLDPS